MEFKEVTAMLEYSGESYDLRELDDSHYQITRINERSIAEVLIFEIYGLSNKCVSRYIFIVAGGKKFGFGSKRIKASDIKKNKLHYR